MREEEPVLSAMFDGFWEAYPSNCPRKSNKAKCLKKYISLLKAVKDPAALHNAILDGLARWKRCVDWTEDDGKFIKAPLVWLNNENWEDAPKAAASEQKDDDGRDEAKEFLRRHKDKRLFHVFRAMIYGLTFEEFGVPERTFRRLRRKVENILAAHPTKFRLGL